MSRPSLSGLLPVTPAGRVLALGIGISAAGSGAFLGSSVLYFVGEVGFSASRVGLALSIAGCCGILSPLPFGRIADRVHPARLYLILLILRCVMYAGFAFVRDYAVYLVLACVATAVDRACSPLQQLVVAAVEGERHRTRALASVNALRNAGASAGFLLAGVVLGLGTGQAGFRALFLFNAATFLIVAVTVGMVPRATAATVPAPAVPAAPRPATAAGPFRDVRYIVLALGNGLLCLFDSVLLVMFPAWLAVGDRLPTVIAPLMLCVNAVLTIVALVPASRRAQGRAAARRVIAWSAACMAFGSVAFAAADALRLTVLVLGLIGVAVVAYTFGEIFENVAAYELSFDQAPRDRRGQYVALFHAASNAQGVIGPLVMTAVLLPAGPIGWLALVPVFGLGLLAVQWGTAGVTRVPEELAMVRSPGQADPRP